MDNEKLWGLTKNITAPTSMAKIIQIGRILISFKIKNWFKKLPVKHKMYYIAQDHGKYL